MFKTAGDWFRNCELFKFVEAITVYARMWVSTSPDSYTKWSTLPFWLQQTVGLFGVKSVQSKKKIEQVMRYSEACLMTSKQNSHLAVANFTLAVSCFSKWTVLCKHDWPPHDVCHISYKLEVFVQRRHTPYNSVSANWTVCYPCQ